jgi:hypothetical protein
MDSGLSTVRNLLYIVLVLALLAVATNLYVATQLSQNSEELSRLSTLLEKQLGTSGIDQSQKLIDRLDQAHRDADAIDGKLAKAREDFMADLNNKAPGIVERAMDKYIQKKAPQLERQAIRQMPRQ